MQFATGLFSNLQSLSGMGVCLNCEKEGTSESAPRRGTQSESTAQSTNTSEHSRLSRPIKTMFSRLVNSVLGSASEASPAQAAAQPSPSSQVDACAVCLTSLERRGGKALINPGCGHELHLACYQQLVARTPDANCPTCRGPVNISGRPLNAASPASAPSRWSSRGTFDLFSTMQQTQQNVPNTGTRPLPTARNASPFFSLAAQANPALDDPVDVSAANQSIITNYDYKSLINLSLDAETDPLTCKQTTATAMLSLNVRPNPNMTEDRNALDLVIVIDKSGSMSGRKIQTVRETLQYIVDELSPADRLSIVLFNSEARVLCQLKKLSDEGKTELRGLIESVETDGGTTIAGGLSLGLDIIAHRATKNKSCAILLLSDGQDMARSSMTYGSLKLRAESLSCPVFSFGIGADHDANCLTTLAARGGAFTYLDTMDITKDAFAGAVGALKGIAVKDCRLVLQVPAGMKITKVMSGYPVKERTEGKIVVEFSDLFYEEARNLLVDIELPESGAGRQGILTANAEFTIFDNNNSDSSASAPLQVNRVNASEIPATQAKHPEVMKHKLRLSVSEAMKDALRLADDGNDFEGARRVLQASKDEVQAYLDQIAQGDATTEIPLPGSSPASTNSPISFLRALLADLTTSISHFRSRASLDAGGRAYTHSTVLGNVTQRTVTSQMPSVTSRVYQSATSTVYSARARTPGVN